MKDQAKKGESRFRRQQRSLARLIERLKTRPTPYRQEKEAQYREIMRRSKDAAKSADGQPGGLADREEWLEQTGLETHHLRAITAILRDAEIATAFLNEKTPLGLTEALEKIRQKALPPPSPQDEQAASVKVPRQDLNALLTILCSELLRPPHTAKPFPLKCGIYELAFTNRPKGDIFVTPPRVLEPETPNQVELREEQMVCLEVAPDIAESLGKAARFCGLTRAEVVAELVTRQDPAGLIEALNAPETYA
jgi:hypothetical protein